MDNPGKIEGRKLVELFNTLIEKRVIISMHLTGTDFERLTCLVGIQAHASGYSLRIDLPEGMRAAAAKTDAVTLRFNFNGPDRLEYVFSTEGIKFNHRELVTPFPEYVDRIQRRKDFRMQTPSGTRLLIKHDKIHAILNLINISLGGAFAVMKKHNLKNVNEPIFALDESVTNARIIVPEGTDRKEMVIIIQTAIVRRIERDRQSKRFRYAFEFKDMDAREKHKLTQSIYYFQRLFLQRR